MNSTDQVVAEISRDMLISIAPSELPMFRANSALYFTDPDRALAPAKSKDEMLGFGVAEAAAFLTPVVLAAVRAVLDFAIAEFGKAARGQGEAVITGWVKSLFRSLKLSPAEASAAVAVGSPPLTREQLQRLREVAVEKARLYVDENQAGRLADELVGRLAIAS